MGQQDAYCSICGGPFNLGSSHTKWTHTTLLLTAAEPDTDGKLIPARFRCQESAVARRVMRIRAGFDGGSYFHDEATSGSSKLRVLNPEKTNSQTEPDVYGPLFFPVHECCMEILDQVASQREHEQNPSPGTISDETTLWMVLESRFRNLFVPSNLNHVQSCSNMPEPHDYFGAERCRNISWEHDDDPEAAAIFEADPCQRDTDTANNSSRNRKRILKILELARFDDIPKRVPEYQRRRQNMAQMPDASKS